MSVVAGTIDLATRPFAFREGSPPGARIEDPRAHSSGRCCCKPLERTQPPSLTGRSVLSRVDDTGESCPVHLAM